MIRVRGVPISESDARELASRLGRSESVGSLLDRLGRALESGGGTIATDPVETRAALAALDGMLGEREPYERLLELRATLVATLTHD